MEEFEAFVSTWDSCEAKDAFLVFRQALEAVDGVTLDFKARPGITYSLRGAHPDQQGRDLFALIDVIDDDPEQRWLSVCFYDDLVTDEQEQGDWVPGGLMGEDARCFNVDEADEDLVTYVVERIREAGAGAAK
ncbi:MAG: hypothetical protein RBR38_08595 [Desulfomicrobium apsheronum]|nr:hypothetical protein [Desulfomicrobium apsheronum]MDY0226876.1 hypothetical protein [Desulfomicrobium apsheronum]